MGTTHDFFTRFRFGEIPRYRLRKEKFFRSYLMLCWRRSAKNSATFE